MEVKLHINNPKSARPELVGVYIDGYGWIIGGDEKGELVIVFADPFDGAEDGEGISGALEAAWATAERAKDNLPINIKHEPSLKFNR